MTTTYKPHPTSTAGLVIAFFQVNPTEILSTYDIAQKFDINHKNVHTFLRDAVDASMLRRNRDDDGVYCYTAGPNINTRAAAKPKAAPKTTSQTPEASQPTQAPPYAQDAPYSIALIQQLTVVKNRTYTLRQSTKGVSKWDALFQRLTENGESVDFPIVWRKAVASAVQKFSRDNKTNPAIKHTYRVTSNNGTATLWRVEKTRMTT